VRGRRGLVTIGLVLAVAVSSSEAAAAGPLDMRARVSALRYLPMMSVSVTSDAIRSLHTSESSRLRDLCRDIAKAKCYPKSLQPKEAVLSRVYDQPRAGARELGVIIGRRVAVSEPESGGDMVGIELVCRLHGEAARPRWVEQHTFEYGTTTLGMEFRLTRDGKAAWAKLPPAACGRPVWWPMQSTDVRGDLMTEVPGDLYSFPAIRGEIAYTGAPVRLDPQAAYRLLRIHDGVMDVRRQIESDINLEGTPSEGAPYVVPAGTLPPTIRVKISDVIDADGRLRLSVAYPLSC